MGQWGSMKVFKLPLMFFFGRNLGCTMSCPHGLGRVQANIRADKSPSIVFFKCCIFLVLDQDRLDQVYFGRDSFPVFCLTFSVFQSRKTINSIEIDGHGFTGIKLENGNSKTEKLKKSKNCKTEKKQKTKTENSQTQKCEKG